MNYIAQMKNELQKEKNSNKELKRQKFIEQFAERIGHTLMVILANKSFDEWPQEAKKAFEHENRKTPTSAQMYMSRHSQINAKGI